MSGVASVLYNLSVSMSVFVYVRLSESKLSVVMSVSVLCLGVCLDVWSYVYSYTSHYKL